MTAGRSEQPGASTMLSIEVAPQANATLVTFSGAVTDTADFDDLLGLKGRVIFDLADITRLNSVGVGLWIKMMRALGDCEVVFRRCSPAMVGQMNLIDGMAGDATVESLFAPYVCEATGETRLELLRVDELPTPPKAPVLGSASRPWVLDDEDGHYFAFLGR